MTPQIVANQTTIQEFTFAVEGLYGGMYVARPSDDGYTLLNVGDEAAPWLVFVKEEAGRLYVARQDGSENTVATRLCHEAVARERELARGPEPAPDPAPPAPPAPPLRGVR